MSGKSEWANRIVGSGVEPAGSLLANPLNWRKHPARQRKALAKVLKKVGWVQEVIVNRTTGHLVDGHLRVELALAEGEDTPVPVKYVELTEEEEKAILATLDPIGALARTDTDVFEELVASLDADFSDLLLDDVDIAGLATDWDGPPAPDIVWPSDNEFGIPLLDAEMQATEFVVPLGIWGSTRRSAKFSGTWAFYTEDYRFTQLWEKPGQVVATGAVAAVEPNYSCYAEMPVAVGLWAIYRKRWIARFWQRYGIRVFVDLNVSPKFYEYNLLGVPEGWRAYATRGYGSRLEYTEKEYETACERAGGEPLFLVYGGGKAVKEAAQAHGWIWIPEVMSHGKR